MKNSSNWFLLKKKKAYAIIALSSKLWHYLSTEHKNQYASINPSLQQQQACVSLIKRRQGPGEAKTDNSAEIKRLEIWGTFISLHCFVNTCIRASSDVTAVHQLLMTALIQSCGPFECFPLSKALNMIDQQHRGQCHVSWIRFVPTVCSLQLNQRERISLKVFPVLYKCVFIFAFVIMYLKLHLRFIQCNSRLSCSVLGCGSRPPKQCSVCPERTNWALL